MSEIDDDIEVLIYHGDDFDAWNAENNPNRLPVVQRQTVRHPAPATHLGGWVLQRPNNRPPYNWVAVPLNAAHEAPALAEANDRLREHYDRKYPDSRPN